ARFEVGENNQQPGDDEEIAKVKRVAAMRVTTLRREPIDVKPLVDPPASYGHRPEHEDMHQLPKAGEEKTEEVGRALAKRAYRRPRLKNQENRSSRGRKRNVA